MEILTLININYSQYYQKIIKKFYFLIRVERLLNQWQKQKSPLNSFTANYDVCISENIICM